MKRYLTLFNTLIALAYQAASVGDFVMLMPSIAKIYVRYVIKSFGK